MGIFPTCMQKMKNRPLRQGFVNVTKMIMKDMIKKYEVIELKENDCKTKRFDKTEQ